MDKAVSLVLLSALVGTLKIRLFMRLQSGIYLCINFKIDGLIIESKEKIPLLF